MIKRTLFFGNPCRLSKKDMQLLFEPADGSENKTVPIEDVGMLILDNQQISISSALLAALTENNAAVLTTNFQHMPEGLLLPMTAHHAFTDKVRYQMGASEPLKKNLWQQTVMAKIRNQAVLLGYIGAENQSLIEFSAKVRSGDPENLEGRASAFYWKNLFEENPRFKRGRFEGPPNNLLNYGYAVLRAVIARSLVGSGMTTYMGIHHRNKYNPFCLADDIMEPYRPFVDKIVLDIVSEEENIEELTPAIKKKILVLPAMDITIDNQNSPLMIGAQRTAASLMDCFEGSVRKLIYPEMKL